MSEQEKTDVGLYFIDTTSDRECKLILKDLIEEKQVENDTLLRALERRNVIQINNYPRTQHK